MPKVSKHRMRQEICPEEVESFKNHLKILNDELDLFSKTIKDLKSSKHTNHGFKSATVDLDSWLKENKEQVVETREPMASSIFLTKLIVEALSTSTVGAVTERDLKAILIDTCRILGIRSTNRGTISGLGIDISTVCAVLYCLGVTEPTTVTAPMSERQSTSISSTSSSCNQIPTTACGILGQFRNMVSPLVSNDSSSSSSSGTAAAGTAAVAKATSQAQRARAAVEALSSFDDHNAVLQAEVDLLGSEKGEKGETQNQNSGQNPKDSGPKTGALVVKNLVERWRRLLGRYYVEIRQNGLRVCAAKEFEERKNASKLSQSQGVATATTATTAVAPGSATAAGSTAPVGVGAGGGVGPEKGQATGTAQPKASGTSGTSAAAPVMPVAQAEVAASSAPHCYATQGYEETGLALGGAETGTASSSSSPRGDPLSLSHAKKVNAKRPLAQKAWRLTADGLCAEAGVSNSSDFNTAPSSSSNSKTDQSNTNTQLEKHLSAPQDMMSEWMNVCYEEAAALELEELVLRRLAGQCNQPLEQSHYRHGTRFLLDGLKLTADGLVVSHAPGGAEQSFREGTLFTGMSLWSKARRRFKRNRQAMGLSGRGGGGNMPLGHPHHQNGSMEHFNYDQQAVHLFNMKRAEQERSGNNSSKNKGSRGGHAVAWNDPNHAYTNGPYVNPRYSLPIGWNRTDHIFGMADSMQLPEGTLFANFNQTQYPPMGTTVLPDLLIKTSEVPWSMVAKEFMLMSADDMDLSKPDTGVSPRLNGRSTRGSFDFGSRDFLDKCAGKDSADSKSKRGRPAKDRSGSQDEVQLQQWKKIKSSPSNSDRSAPSSPRQSSHDDLSVSPRLSRQHSGSNLGLGAAQLKEVEVVAPIFEIVKYDLDVEVAKLRASGENIPASALNMEPGSYMYASSKESKFRLIGGNGGLEQAEPTENDDESGNNEEKEKGDRKDGKIIIDFLASPLKFDVDDVSDEAMGYRHEVVLKDMRDRWGKLAKLKQEQRDSLPGSPRAGHGSPRGNFSGLHKSKRRVGVSGPRSGSRARSDSANFKKRGRPPKSPGSAGPLDLPYDSINVSLDSAAVESAGAGSFVKAKVRVKVSPSGGNDSPRSLRSTSNDSAHAQTRGLNVNSEFVGNETQRPGNASATETGATPMDTE